MRVRQTSLRSGRALAAILVIALATACGGGGGDGGGGVTPPSTVRVPASVTFDGGGSVAGTVGAALGTPIAVVVRTADNLPVPRTTVTFAASAGTIGTTSAQTDDNGRATAGSWTLGNTSGVQTLTAQAGSVSAQLAATAAAGTAARLEVVTALPGSVRAGVAITPAPSVRARDQFDNIVNRPGTVVTVSLQVGTGTLAGAQATTDAAGLATFSALSLGGLVASGPRTLAFSSAGLPTIAATPLALEAGSATTITLQNVPVGARAGVTVSPGIVALVADQFDNPLTRPTPVTATIASGGGVVSGGTATTDLTGHASFPSLSIDGVVGTRQLRFASEQVSVTTGSLVLSPGDPAQLTITSQPTIIENTLPFPAAIAVRVTDRFGNGVGGGSRTVSVSVGSGGGALLGTAAATDAVGVATFTSLRIVGSEGPRILVFSTAGLASASSAPIQLIAGPPRSMAFFQQPSGTIISGVPLVTQPALQLADTSGNVVRQAGTLVRATLLDAVGELLNDVAVTNSSGLAIFEQLTFIPANAFPPATLRLRFSSGAQASVVTGNVNIQPPQASAVRSVAYGSTAQRLFIVDPGQTLGISAVARDLLGLPLAGVPLVYHSASTTVATVRSTGAITGVGGGSGWVRAFGAGAPSIMDSVYVTVPRDPTAPVVSTTQIAPIPVREGVTAGFDIILDTRNATVGAATIVLSMPPEFVNGLTIQGIAGTVINFDTQRNALRISLVSSAGLKGIISIAQVTITSGAPEAYVLNREIVITPYEMIDITLQNLTTRSTGVNIPLVP
ncbi:MAG: Ig-like domain-containing protein [Gemmatimonadota bacterium]